MPNVRTIASYVFYECKQLTEAELSEDLARIGEAAFINSRLRHIAMPLKDDMFDADYVFEGCRDLSQIDLVGGIHKTVLLNSWRNEMNDQIDRINRDLPNTPLQREDYSDPKMDGNSHTQI